MKSENGLIIFKSVYGSTRSYAEWLADDLGFDMVSIDDVNTAHIRDYGTIIVGSPVVMNKPFLSSWIVERWEEMRGARVILFTTSGAPPTAPALRDGFDNAIPRAIREQLTWVPLPGHFDYSRLSFLHKLMMQIGALMQKSPDARARMRADFQRPVDNVERMALLPIIESIRNSVLEAVR